jgi:hypothetical protein
MVSRLRTRCIRLRLWRRKFNPYPPYPLSPSVRTTMEKGGEWKIMKATKPLEQSSNAKLAMWRAGRVHELSLPSGLVVQVTDVTMTDLLFTGKLPPALVTMAEQSAKGGKAEMDLQSISQNAGEFGQLLDALVMICVKDPPMAAHGDAEHLGIDEIPGDDKMFIFNWINRESAAVQPFRDEGTPVPVGLAGKTVLDETQ